MGSVNVTGNRKQPFGEATSFRGWASWLIASGTSSDTLEPPSWGAKIPKLLWRGVPMVDVRQVSSGVQVIAVRPSKLTGGTRSPYSNSCEPVVISRGPMSARSIGARSRRPGS